jgi:hypothetical protein
MGDVDCTTFLGSVAELAAGVVDEPERTVLLDHADGCPSCRSELDGLADAIDRLVILAPAADPPPGFEAAVLERWAVGAAGAEGDTGASRAEAPARPRLAALAVAALLALGLGVVLGRSLTAPDDAGDGQRAAPGRPADLAAGHGAEPIVTVDGTVIGSTFLDRTDPPTVVLVLTRVEAGERYRCLVIDAAGAEREVGSWTVQGWLGGSWSVPLPEDLGSPGTDAAPGAGLRGVALRGEDGTLVATGTFA